MNNDEGSVVYFGDVGSVPNVVSLPAVASAVVSFAVV